ncbi:MAG: YbaK/EbsC family protein [Spirochaetaceae bacterium]|nr:MAG: YbaK/EbsC family protein [Spirochaetaceae bacterium]
MIPEKVREILKRHNLEAIEFEPGSTPTAVLAAQKLGVGVGNIAKSLLFVAKDGRRFMVVCPGDRKVANAKLKATIGTKTRMANAEETLAATGFQPGGVCPFGIQEIEILLDVSLKEFDTIYPAAGTDSSGVPMSFEELRRITGGRICDCTAD